MSREGQALPGILVFTDDIDFYLQLNYILSKEGFCTYLVGSPEEFCGRPPGQKTGVVILDSRISCDFASAAGECIRADHEAKDAPVIILARDESQGAAIEPAVAKRAETYASPIVPETLIMRVRSCIDAANSAQENTQDVVRAVRYRDLEMNLTTYRVKRGDRDIHLSPIEFKLLRHFLERPEQAVSRDELKTVIWEDRIHVEPRTVDVHVGRLRRALAGQTQRNLIRTIRSVGYALYD